MRLICCAVLFALCSVPAAAITTDAQPAEQQTSKPKKERKICRVVQKTGSRMNPKVCKTQAEWDAIPAGDIGAEVQNKAQPN